MTANQIVNPAGLPGDALSKAGPNLMRSFLQTIINSLLSADTDAVVEAEYGHATPGRTAQLSGYRHRDFNTWVEAIDSQASKLHSGTYLSSGIAESRQRVETALITVVTECCLAGVSTRRMDKLVKTLGINSLSKFQLSRMTADSNEHVLQLRHRPLGEAGPFTFVAADALTMRLHEGGRIVATVVLVATRVNADGRLEFLGLFVATNETGLAWDTCFADFLARGRTGAGS